MDSETRENVDVTLRAFESLSRIWGQDKVEGLLLLREEATRRLCRMVGERAAGKVIALPERK